MELCSTYRTLSFYRASVTVTMSQDIWNKNQNRTDHKDLHRSFGYQKSKNCCSSSNRTRGRVIFQLRLFIAKSLREFLLYTQINIYLFDILFV